MSVREILTNISQNVEEKRIEECCDSSQHDKKDIIKPKITYICDDILLKMCDRLPKTPNRASIVHELIKAYGLLEQLDVVPSRVATVDEVTRFHSSDYVSCVTRLSNRDDDEKYEEADEEFGMTYDCPAFPGCHDYACHVTGASLVAAQLLVDQTVTTAINWTGGWHHAKRDQASGFCYYNDIVVAILKLREKYERVLYVDIDLHHGDGVEDAFCVTSKVLTVSFHKHSPGFFPGTGSMADTGYGKGRHYAVNVPLRDGIQDTQYVDVVKRVLGEVLPRYQPQVVVCQAGADGLTSDPMDSFNLTPAAYVDVLTYIQNWRLPLLVLGGGGYHTPNTARCWTLITAALIGQTVEEDIPEHRYFPLYGPDYDVKISPGNRPNENSTEYVDNVITNILGNLANLEQR